MVMRPLDQDDDELEQADWIGEEGEDSKGFWRRHLARQLERGIVAMAIAILILAMRNAGGPGHWILARLSAATRTEYYGRLGNLNAAHLDTFLAKVRTWLAREWQVSGPALQQANEPPTLSWPVRGGQMLTSGTARTSDGPGLDLQVAAGTPVLAAAGGFIIEIRQEKTGNSSLVLRHGGDWRTIYANCQGALVTTGEKVSGGQPIALVGSAPPPAPAHLHFELWGPSGALDPIPYLSGSVPAANEAL